MSECENALMHARRHRSMKGLLWYHDNAKSLSCAIEDLPFLIVDLIVLAAGPTSTLVSSYTAVLVLVLELPSEILIPALAMASISDVGGESYSMSMSSS